MMSWIRKRIDDLCLGERLCGRFCISSAIALISGWLIFWALLYFEPIENKAMDLYGGLAFMIYENISNRLTALNIFLCFTFMVFVLILFSPIPLRICDKFSKWTLSLRPIGRQIKEISLSMAQCLKNIGGKILNLGVPNAKLRDERSQSAEFLFSGFFLSLFAAPVVLLIASFTPLSAFYQPLKNILICFQIVLLSLTFYLWLFSPKKALPIFNLLLMFLVLPYFLVLIPKGLSVAFSARLIFIIATLIALGIVSILRNRRKILEQGYFPLIVLLACLCGYMFSGRPIPTIWDNPYEFGSRLPEYWMITRGWVGIFKDMYITYGLWDIASIGAGELLFGELTASSASLGFTYPVIVSSALFFVLAKRIIPVFAAFALTIFIASNSAIVIPCIFAAILLQPRLIENPAKWLVIWGLLSAFLPFARIPQGSVAVMASLPAAIYQIALLYKSTEGRRGKFYAVLAFGLFVAFIVAVYPFGSNFSGFIRIILETAQINGPFAATAFRQVHLMNFMQIAHLTVFFLMPILAFICAFYIYQAPAKEHKSSKIAAWFLLSFSFVYALASISYSFSRIFDLTKARYTQAISLIICISLLCLWRYSAKMRAKIILSVLLLSLLFYANKSFPHLIPNIWSVDISKKYEIVDGADYGVAEIGKIVFSKHYPESFIREEKVVKDAMNKILEKDETFLDLTVEGLHYFTSGRKVWTEYPVYYVYPGNKPQRRAVESLKNKNVRVSLLDNKLVLDRSNVNLRGYHLYRYALLNGLPWEISEHKTVLMPPEYFKKIGKTAPNKLQTLRMLDKHFPIKAAENAKELGYAKEAELFFAHLPAVWGAAFKDFEKDLPQMAALSQKSGDGYTFIYVFSDGAFQGRLGGLLYLDIDDIAEGKTIYLTIRWVNEELPSNDEINEVRFIAHKGINLVPVEASPRWLLAERIVSLTLFSDEKERFSIKEAKIFDRTKI